MSDDPKCVAGCVSFYGGEKRHHKDCPYYPESLTKANADRIEELEALVMRKHKRGEILAEGWRISDDARIEAEAKLVEAVEGSETTTYNYDKAPTDPHHGGKLMPHQMQRRIEELEDKLSKAVCGLRTLKEHCMKLSDPRYENSCREIIDILQQN